MANFAKHTVSTGLVFIAISALLVAFNSTPEGIANIFTHSWIGLLASVCLALGFAGYFEKRCGAIDWKFTFWKAIFLIVLFRLVVGGEQFGSINVVAVIALSIATGFLQSKKTENRKESAPMGC